MDDLSVLRRAAATGNLHFDQSDPPDNVRNIQAILSEQDFEYLFPMRKAEYAYRGFLSGAAYWPSFCADAELCRNELAVVFSHMVQETGAHDDWNPDVPSWRQGLYHLTEMYCPDAAKCHSYTQWTNTMYPPQDGKLYYGRGAKQLSWNYNYGPFSLLMTGDKMTFLNNPDLILQPEYVFSAAMWFYMTPQSPKPSMHDVVTGCWIPNGVDISEGRVANTAAERFALTTHIINGLQECPRGGDTQNARWRFEYYIPMSDFFQVSGRPTSMAEYIPCGNSAKFGEGAAGADLLLFLTNDWTLPEGQCGCQLVNWDSGYFRTLDMLAQCEMDTCGFLGGSVNGGAEAGWSSSGSLPLSTSAGPTTTTTTTTTLPRTPGTCAPCTSSDAGCTRPGEATQAWCDAGCTNGENNAHCPADYCYCTPSTGSTESTTASTSASQSSTSSSTSSTSNASTVKTCIPCKSSDAGCTHPGQASQAWCDERCTNGENNAHCPEGFCKCGDFTTTTLPPPEPQEDSDAVRICYFQNWVRWTMPLLEDQDIFKYGFDGNLCTHIYYGFGAIEDQTYEAKMYDEWADPDGFAGLRALKQQYPHLKSLWSTGGWTFNECSNTKYATTGAASCHIFSEMVDSVEGSRRHALSVIRFLRLHGFDGYDVDWEYPGVAGRNSLDNAAHPEDKANYVRFLQILREEFEKEALDTNQEQLLLTVAVGVGKDNVEVAYDIPAISAAVDLLGLMTYDLHGYWDLTTGLNSALYPTDADIAQYGYPLSVDWAVNYWINAGASPDKLVLGLAPYGRGFTLATKGQNQGPLSPVSATTPWSPPGPQTNENGYYSYLEITDMLASGGTEYYDEQRKSPYMISADGSQWVGYDNPSSLREKVDFLKKKGLRGAMIWAIELDDFREMKFPCLRAIKNQMLGYRLSGSSTSSTTTTETPPTSSTLSTTTTQTPTTSSTTTTETPPTSSTSASTSSTTSTQTPTTSSTTTTSMPPSTSSSTSSTPFVDCAKDLGVRCEGEWVNMGDICDVCVTTTQSSTSSSTTQSSTTTTSTPSTFVCPSGKFVSTNGLISDTQCQIFCLQDIEDCLAAGSCHCSTGKEEESASMEISVIVLSFLVSMML